MTARAIRWGIDALFVEGPDDGATVNAIVTKVLATAIEPQRLVKCDERGGGFETASRQFDAFVRDAHDGARIGLIVDRDTAENDKWPAVRARLAKLGLPVDEPRPDGFIVDGRFGIWSPPEGAVARPIWGRPRGRSRFAARTRAWGQLLRAA